MRDLFEGRPNFAARRSLPHIDELRRERHSLIDRIKPGVSGGIRQSGAIAGLRQCNQPMGGENLRRVVC